MLFSPETIGFAFVPGKPGAKRNPMHHYELHLAGDDFYYRLYKYTLWRLYIVLPDSDAVFVTEYPQGSTVEEALDNEYAHDGDCLPFTEHLQGLLRQHKIDQLINSNH